MFSKKITDSGEFLKMPLSTQCLYFHINLHADDDGIVDNVKTIMRMIGANDDDINLLLAKKFLLIVEGEIVVIRDWWIHNTILRDRYDKSLYKDKVDTIYSINNNKQYTLADNKMLTNSYQEDNKNVNKNVNTDKNSIDENRLDKVKVRDSHKSININTEFQTIDDDDDDNDKDDKVAAALLKYIPSANSIWVEKIDKFRKRNLSDELIIKAIENTALANTRDCRYFMAICEEYLTKGYQSAAEVDEAQQKYKKNRTKTKDRDAYNDWFNQNILNKVG